MSASRSPPGTSPSGGLLGERHDPVRQRHRQRHRQRQRQSPAAGATGQRPQSLLHHRIHPTLCQRAVCRHGQKAQLQPHPPDGVDTAWGARWIIDPNGSVGQVWDRTDAIGPDDHRRSLLGYLDNQVGDAPHKTAQRLLRAGELSWSDDTTVTLYDDDIVTVVGNPRRSFGYLYVGAWFKGDLPTDESPPS
jgi:hypothetical protein